MTETPISSSNFPGEITPWVATIGHQFSEEGILSSAPDFEYRPEQQHMAEVVSAALEQDRPLIVEAGTGVGKSLAYLLPAIQFALENGRTAIISTQTINLQEQLINKDIPLVKSILKTDFKAVLLKGRQNYLCTTRLKRAMQQHRDLFTQGEDAELKKIYEWSKTTTDGTLADLKGDYSPKVWAQVCSDPHACTPRHCGPDSGCFYQEVKRQIAQAKVVVLNHTLLFGLLSQGGFTNEDEGDTGFILPNDFLIIDEAHTIENIAAQQLGLRLSHLDLKYELHRLFNPRTKKGLLVASGGANCLTECLKALEATDEFFDSLEQWANFEHKGHIVRVTSPEIIPNVLARPLADLSQALLDFSSEAKDEYSKAERRDAASRIMNIVQETRDFIEQTKEAHVYWLEYSNFSSPNITINAAPIEVSNQLNKILFNRQRAVIVTSATLSTGNKKLNYFCSRTGALGSPTVQIGSPFDYAHQMRIQIAASMLEPTAPQYEEKLSEWIRYCLEESDGHAFVLFTSYGLMQRMAEKLEPFCKANKWTFLIQGKTLQRSEMVNVFKEADNAILFGTGSFWTGVDVPGEALQHVIITRIPFDVPNHPLIQARTEAIEARGGHPFFEYSIPEAILRLRQGAGRLIRTKKDTGRISILDSRIYTKNYGRRFLGAFPPEAPIEFL